MRSPGSNEFWLQFHSRLMGWDCFKKGKLVPKCGLYWAGYHEDDILAHKTDVDIVLREE